MFVRPHRLYRIRPTSELYGNNYRDTIITSSSQCDLVNILTFVLEAKPMKLVTRNWRAKWRMV